MKPKPLTSKDKKFFVDIAVENSGFSSPNRIEYYRKDKILSAKQWLMIELHLVLKKYKNVRFSEVLNKINKAFDIEEEGEE